jgi:hypothetical protein
MKYQTKEKGLIKVSILFVGGGLTDRITYGGVVSGLHVYSSEQCPELILGTSIKTHNIITFYKFLSHLGMHHTPRQLAFAVAVAVTVARLVAAVVVVVMAVIKVAVARGSGSGSGRGRQWQWKGGW